MKITYVEYNRTCTDDQGRHGRVDEKPALAKI